MVQHLAFNDTLNHGRLLRRGLQQLEDGKEAIKDVLATMSTMLDGDGSQDAHFTYVAEKFGFPSNAVAKSAWDELQSLFFKLSTDSEVTAVDAAMTQAFNKFR